MITGRPCHYKIFVHLITLFFQGCLRTNEKAVVMFRFNNRPEYIRPGSRLVFREGRTKGMGEVTKIFPYDPPPPDLR